MLSALVYDGQQTQRPTSNTRVSANGAAHLVVLLIMVTVTGILRAACRRVNANSQRSNSETSTGLDLSAPFRLDG